MRVRSQSDGSGAASFAEAFAAFLFVALPAVVTVAPFSAFSIASRVVCSSAKPYQMPRVGFQRKRKPLRASRTSAAGLPSKAISIDFFAVLVVIVAVMVFLPFFHARRAFVFARSGLVFVFPFRRLRLIGAAYIRRRGEGLCPRKSPNSRPIHYGVLPFLFPACLPVTACGSVLFFLPLDKGRGMW